MGRADSDNAGGSGGGGGRGGAPGGGGSSSGGGGSTGGGGRSTNSDGRDTPGSPSAADGRRGSSMGPDGGIAGGSTGGGGAIRDTPGPVNATDNRRGSSMGSEGARAGANGSTAASRARSAFDRHEREGLYGVGDSYSLAGALNTEKKDGTMSPRQMDMSLGIEDGQQAQIGAQAVGLIASMAPVSIPGKVSMTTKAAEEGLRKVASTPETDYGAAHARQHTQNTTTQDVAQTAAGLTMGPIGDRLVGAVNIGINDRRSREALGLDAPAPSAGNGTDGNSVASASSPGSVGGGTLSSARNAMAPTTAQAAPAPTRPSFEWSPVDMNAYSQGLIRSNMG